MAFFCFFVFLEPFCCGENNGGRALFQTKRAQQVPCMLLVVVYIVLCSEVYTTAPEKSCIRLEQSLDQDSKLKIDPWSCASLFRFQAIFLPSFKSTIAAAGQARLFIPTFWNSSQRPTSYERGTTLHGRATD